ncbi:hypothetical protein I6M34_01895 [Shewanella algae]|uniref:hypothetical protein n=1 Tax=Shewanella algae TaxID=38313 RepID=UPI001AAD134F|nr:hypothetical protein [Shewanella algae]MBO2601871.1 hypothetical protein [Shewanella algae]
MNNFSACSKCKCLRPISNHLYELARLGELLNNSNEFISEERSRVVSTYDLSQWLKLAAQLVSVKVDAWKFSGVDGLWCRPAADMYDSDSKHYSNFCFHLNRFIYTYNALEEVYKFLDGHYSDIPKKVRSHSIKFAILLDNSEELLIPENFWHLSENFQNIVGRYHSAFQRKIDSEMMFNGKASYALDLIRNIRNHIAHGVFPIVENPDYDIFDGKMSLVVKLLGHSCRLAALYIQIAFMNFNHGFEGDINLFVDTLDDSMVEPFLIKHLHNAHLISDFGLNPNEFAEWEMNKLGEID